MIYQKGRYVDKKECNLKFMNKAKNLLVLYWCFSLSFGNSFSDSKVYLKVIFNSSTNQKLFLIDTYFIR